MEVVICTPGGYKAAVNIRYHVDGDPPEVLRAVTQGAVVHVADPQSVILFGAALGGLLGYVITLLFLSDQSQARITSRKSTLANLLRFIAGAFGSILLSAIVTILLA